MNTKHLPLTQALILARVKERLGLAVHRIPISGWEQMCAGVPRERLEAAC